MNKDEYLTIKEAITVKKVIERSRFIAHAREVNGEREARRFIQDIKEEHRQATHNCSAYALGWEQQAIHFFDDDGEPGGSAGKPILGAILKQNLTNVAVVVTRYFGGKKLGIRGLIDAYGGVAEEALTAAGNRTRILTETIPFNCDYEQVNRVMYLVDKYNAKIQSSNYTDQVEMVLVIRQGMAATLRQELAPYVAFV